MISDKNQESIVWDLVIGMLIYAAIIEVIVLIVSEALVFDTIGLCIGIAIGIAMLVHMKRSIEDALDIGEEHASKHMIKKSVLRSLAVAIAFLLLGYLQIGSMLTALIGLLGLKISVYSQPYIYKVRRNLRKGG